MATARTLAPLVALAALASLATGCAGDDQREPVGTVTDLSALYPPAAPALAPSLRVSGSAPYAGFRGPIPTLGRTDGTHGVVVTRGGLTGYDPATHEETWTRDLGSVCGGGVSAIDDGRVAVLTGLRGDARTCARVVVVDVASGDLEWVRSLGDPDAIFHPGVSLGGGTVYAGSECGSTLRFDVADGAPLPALTAADRVCGHEPAFGDGVVATWEDAESAATPDTLGPGWIPPYDGAGRLRLIDTATGEQEWQRVMDRRGSGLDAVVSTDPLVLDVTEDGHRTMRRYDGRGRPVGYLGRGLGLGEQFQVVARSGDVLVGTYSELAGYHAYDVTSGEELWTVDSGRTLAGADADGRLVWVAGTTVIGEDGGPEGQTHVIRTEAADPARGEVLGSIERPDSGVAVVGGDLVKQNSDSVTVLDLPVEGVGPAPEPGESLAGVQAGQLPWAPEDVRPEAVTDVCDTVGDDTLELVGLRTDLPTPATCRWESREEPAYLDRSLDVRVQVSSPEPESVGDATAAEVAAAELAGERRRWTPVPGLGDEARSLVRTRPDGSGSRVELEVRQGNLTVLTQAAVFAQVPQTVPGARAVDTMEQAALAAAADVLDAVDRPLELPEAAPEEPAVTAAPDVCDAVGDRAGSLVGPRAEVTDLSATDDDRIARCGWYDEAGERTADLDVSAYAVPAGVLPGEDGQAVTGEERAADVRIQGRELPGDPDARLVDRSDADSVYRVLTVRQDNLVVTVELTISGPPLPADAERRMRAVADRVLDATSR